MAQADARRDLVEPPGLGPSGEEHRDEGRGNRDAGDGGDVLDHVARPRRRWYMRMSRFGLVHVPATQLHNYNNDNNYRIVRNARAASRSDGSSVSIICCCACPCMLTVMPMAPTHSPLRSFTATAMPRSPRSSCCSVDQ